jgi:hypothetical protein
MFVPWITEYYVERRNNRKNVGEYEFRMSYSFCMPRIGRVLNAKMLEQSDSVVPG